ncbi:MAG TPA: DNA mismatch repair protein MutT [Rhodobacteraceae bacterium]|jgi:8-oxo-dGTP diphosphatase|nr:DNA mismatch repair protein MutT [Paracoccaceae bacterium]
MTFSGAKLALFIGADLLVIRRDDLPDIPYPGHWDLPGGGRENREGPAVCALRETWEEVGLSLHPRQLVWSRSYLRPRGAVWFFAAHLPESAAGRVRLGGEGQEWRLMPPATYRRHPLAVPHFAEQVRRYMADARFPGLTGRAGHD